MRSQDVAEQALITLSEYEHDMDAEAEALSRERTCPEQNERQFVGQIDHIARS